MEKIYPEGAENSQSFDAGNNTKKNANKVCMSHKLIHLHLFHIRKKFSVHTTIEIVRRVGEIITFPRAPIKLTPRGTYVFYMSLNGFTTVRIARDLKND